MRDITAQCEIEDLGDGRDAIVWTVDGKSGLVASTRPGIRAKKIPGGFALEEISHRERYGESYKP